MASKRDLKKDINYVLGDIIENVYLWEKTNNKGEKSKESEAIIDDSISTFDSLMAKVNERGIEDSKTHYNSIRAELENEAKKLVDRINSL